MVFIGSAFSEASSWDAAAKGREQRSRAVAKSHGSAAAGAGSGGCLWPRAEESWGPRRLGAGWMHPIPVREDPGRTLRGVCLFVL